MSRRQKPHLRCPGLPDAPQPLHLRPAAAHRDADAGGADRPPAGGGQADEHGPRRRALPAVQHRRLPGPGAAGRGRRVGRTMLSARRPDWPAAVAAAAAGVQPLVLYPHPSATPLEDWRGRTEPVALVVPDGTWAQATRIHARFAARAGDLPCVSLPASRSGKRLRTGRSPHQMATLEAVALALGILEGPEVEAALLRVYRIMTERTLWTNGRIATADVTGGIPAGHPQARPAVPARALPRLHAPVDSRAMSRVRPVALDRRGAVLHVRRRVHEAVERLRAAWGRAPRRWRCSWRARSRRRSR